MLIHCHYKPWKSQYIFNITPIIFIWKKKVIYTQDFWVNYPFKPSQPTIVIFGIEPITLSMASGKL